MVTLAEKIPFAAVVMDSALTTTCSFCFKQNDIDLIKVSRCLGCRAVSYCSKECQKKDWSNHKRECRVLKNLSPHVPEMMSRVIARVLIRVDKSDPHDENDKKRFEDILDNRDQTNHEQLKDFASLDLFLRQYIGVKHVPKKDVLMSILGKVCLNVIGIGEPDRKRGVGFYIGFVDIFTSMLNLSSRQHSCNPDAYVVFNGNTAIIRSSTVREYSDNVTVAYTNLLCTSTVRHEALSSKYYFTCSCDVCLDPTRDFLLNSVRSTCCPDSYCLLNPHTTELSCFECGAPSNITVEEAIFANQRVNDDLQVTEGAIHHLIQIHEQFSKVLSPFNVNLLRVTDKLFDLAFKLRDDALCLQHAPNILLAYRRHLSIGDPVLAYRLLTLALQVVAFEPTPTREIVELLEQTVLSSTETFDPRYPHFTTVTFAGALVYYREELQNNIS